MVWRGNVIKAAEVFRFKDLDTNWPHSCWLYVNHYPVILVFYRIYCWHPRHYLLRVYSYLAWRVVNLRVPLVVASTPRLGWSLAADKIFSSFHHFWGSLRLPCKKRLLHLHCSVLCRPRVGWNSCFCFCLCYLNRTGRARYHASDPSFLWIRSLTYCSTITLYQTVFLLTHF